MLIIAILAVILVFLIAFMVTGAAAAGSAFIIIFGDVIVACLFIGWLIKRIVRKKKDEK